MAKLSTAFDILTRGADKASRDIDHVGNSSEKTGHKVEGAGKSMRLLAGTFVGASNQALGPLQEIADKFDVIEQASSAASSKVGGRLLGIGAAGVGAGAFLSTLASREKAGLQQLQASIEATGHSFADFEGPAEAAAKSSERFGYQASQTFDALNRLTLTTHNPTEALHDLAVAQDVAAAKHISLAKAAEVVGLTFNGSTRAGKQFGLQLENVAGAAKALETAQKNSATANDRVVSAQQSYNDKLAVYNQTLKPTLAQQQALFRSHQNVAKAQGDAAVAADKLKDAQKKASDAAGAGARNVQKLADVTKGQASANADTFAGHLRALGAQIEDTAGKFGEKYGSAIQTVSVGTIAVGTLIEAGLGAKLSGLGRRLGLTGKAFTGLRDVEVASSAEGTAAVEAAAATDVVALEGVGAAATTAGTEVGLGFTAMLGPIAIVAEAVALLIQNLDTVKSTLKYVVEHPFATSVPGAPESTFHRNLSYTLTHPFATSIPKDYHQTPYTAHDPQTPDDYDQKAGRGAAAVAASAAADDLHATQVRLRDRARAAKDSKQTLQAFLDSIGGGKTANAAMQAAAADAAKATKQAAVDAATALRDGIKAQFETAKSLLHDVMGQALQLRQSIAQSLVQGSQITDVFGTGPNLNGNHAFGAGQDFGAVKRFFEDRLTRLRRFAAELSALLHKGLDPAVVAQIAQAGADQGGRLADALSGSSKGQLGQINTVTRQIGSLTDATGKRVSDVQFRQQIAAAKRTNDILSKELKEANSHLRVISRAKPGSGVDQAASAFLLGA